MRRTTIARAAALVAASVLPMAFSGCGPAAATTTVAAPQAPVAAADGQAGTLPDVKFVDITKEAGIAFHHFNGATRREAPARDHGRGRGLPRLRRRRRPGPVLRQLVLLAQARGPAGPTQALYRNDGKGHFEDVTKAAGLDKTFYGQGVAVGDYDNDGDPDLYVTAVGGGHLFRNDGKGHFEDVTESVNARGRTAGSPAPRSSTSRTTATSTCSSPATSPGRPRSTRCKASSSPGLGRAYGPPTHFSGSFCTLLRNDGGRFVDISESSGVQVATPDLSVPIGKSLGVAPYDVDGDGLVDIAVANDTVQNFLFHNLGGGKFEEIGDPLRRRVRPVGLAARAAWASTGPTSRTTSASAWRSATSPTR